MLRFSRLVIIPFVFTVGCGGDGGGSGGSGGTGGSGGSTPVVARFDAPASTPVDVGKVPFPSDLYLDDAGKIQLGTLPGAANQQFDTAMHAAWSSLDGWGVSTGVFFFVSGGDVDPATVAGAIHVYDLATGAEVPVDSGWNDKRKSIAAVPSAGNVLQDDHRYGAVLTSTVKSAAHQSLVASADFQAIRGAAQAPSDARLAKAWMAVKPAIDAAVAKGIAADQIIAATAWKTESIIAPMEKLRMALDSGTPPVVGSVPTGAAWDAGMLDAKLGVSMLNPPEEGWENPGNGTTYAQRHAHIAWVVHANLNLKSYTGTGPFELGLFQLDSTGTPQVKGNYDALFTIALPAGVSSYQNLPLVIWVSGVKHTRSDMFAIADGFAAKGIAVASIDLPFHGSRAPMGRDVLNNMTGEACTNTGVPCDFIGDASALTPPVYFFDFNGSSTVPAYDPRGPRDSLRQGAADLMLLARALTNPNGVATLRTATGINNLSFNPDVTFVGHSLGGFTGGIVAAVDPKFKVFVLDSAGGGIMLPCIVDGPWFGQTINPMLDIGFGIAGEYGDGVHDSRFHPSLALYQGPIDAGDPIGFARYVVRDPSHRGGTPPHIWMNSVQLDQVVPNDSSEPLGAELGLTRVMLSNMNPTLQFASMTAAAAPYAPSSGPTLAYLRMAVAADPQPMFGLGPAHTLIYWTHDTGNFIPPYPPITPYLVNGVEGDYPMNNPVPPYHRALELFVSAYYAGQQPTVRDPYTCTQAGCP